MVEKPFVSVDPAMRFGSPCVSGMRLPVEIVAERVWVEGVLTAMDEWDLTRGDVLVACWFAGAYGITSIGLPNRDGPYKRYGGIWRRRWQEWAAKVHGDLWDVTKVDYDAIPDPPGRDDE